MKNVIDIRNTQWQRVVFLLLTAVFFNSLSAQMVRINLVMSARPSPYLQEWYRPQNGTAVLTSLSGAAMDRPVRFETELLNSEGQVVYKLPYANSEVQQVSGNAATISLSNILQLQNGNFASPALMNSFSNGGKLSAGQYSIRTKAWDATEDVARSEWTAFKAFLIFSYQLPQLMQPADGRELEVHQANSYVIFRWTPLTPAVPQAAATYRIQIWQVLSGQTPMQSFRSTPPIEDRLIKGTTQFIWQPRLNMIAPEFAGTNQFIWTIQTLDEKDMPMETSDPAADGRSQPFVFYIVNKNVVDSLAQKNTTQP